MLHKCQIIVTLKINQSIVHSGAIMISFDISISHLLFNLLLLFAACESETPQEWDARINQKIDLLRKNDARIVLDEKIYGRNAKLLINQTKISFPMGTAIKARNVANCLDQGTDDKYCKFVKVGTSI